MGIFIDTEIWSFAQKEPEKEKFDGGYEKALEMHKRSKEFLLQNVDKEIVMSYHQIVEIYHVLSFRGFKVPRDFALQYIMGLLSAENILKREVTLEHYRAAVEASARSGIHIWDFLCILPVAEELEVIYTCDQHFLNDEFKRLNVEVINPLEYWINL
jgi:predicted nucleic acid-binding protein